MRSVKRAIVVAVLDVSTSVADAVLRIIDGSGVDEDTVTIHEFVAGCRAAYAEYRERMAAGIDMAR